MPTHSTLCLGNRKDADRWRKGMKEKLGFTEGKFVKDITPSLVDIATFFKQKDDWLFMAGHFSQAVGKWGTWPHATEYRLYNDLDNDHTTPPTLEALFRKDHVLVRRKEGGAWTEKKLARGKEFLQHEKAKVLLWGGCGVCNEDSIEILRELFGKVLIIGWHGKTGWEITDLMMGGFGNKPDPGGWRSPNFWEKLGGSHSDLVKVRNAWLDTAKAITWAGDILSRFCVIDPDGTHHKAT
jgi:hypothetical protein